MKIRPSEIGKIGKNPDGTFSFHIRGSKFSLRNGGRVFDYVVEAAPADSSDGSVATVTRTIADR